MVRISRTMLAFLSDLQNPIKTTKMNSTLTKKIDYLGKINFVKFINTNDFPELSPNTRKFLQETGIYSDTKNYPYFESDGSLKLFDKGIIQLGKTDVGNAFCIDTLHGEQLVSFDSEGLNRTIINSSLEKYIECVYITYYFFKEYERKDLLGDFSKNRKKYAAKLKEMYEEIEGPDIMQFPLWGVWVYEIELGSI